MAQPGAVGGRLRLSSRARRRNFLALAEALAAPHDRRRVLKLMAAAFAMGGLGGCDDGRAGRAN